MLLVFIGHFIAWLVSQLAALGIVTFIYRYYESDFGAKSPAFEFVLATVIAAINAGLAVIAAVLHLHPDRFTPVAATGCFLALNWATHMADYEWLELSILFFANIAVVFVVILSLNTMHVMK